MKVTSMKVSRKFFLGNESMEVSAEAELDFCESFDEAYKKLDALVLSKKPLRGQNGYPRDQRKFEW